MINIKLFSSFLRKQASPVKLSLFLSVSIALSSCVSDGGSSAERDFFKNEKIASGHIGEFSGQSRDSAPVVSLDEIWVDAERVSPGDSSRFDHSWLERNFVVNKGGAMSFYDLLASVEDAYPDVTVSYSDDVPQAFYDGSKKDSSSSLGYPSSADPAASNNGSGTSQSNKSDQINLSYSGSISGLFDLIAAKINLSWKVSGDKKAEFTYLRTKVFRVNVLDGAPTVSSGSSEGSSSSPDQGSSGGSHSVSSNMFPEITDTVGAMLSEFGTMIPSGSTGTVTVTDLPSNLRKVEVYLNGINEELSKQIVLDVKVFKLSKQKSDQYGLDWDLFYKTVGSSFSLTNPTPLDAFNASFGVGVLKPNSPFENTKSIVQALSMQGGLSVVTESQAITLNNMPVPLRHTNSISFVESQTPATKDASGSITNGSIQQGKATTGFNFTFVPRILEKDNILLQISLSLSELTALVSRSASGSSDSEVVQTPEISEDVFFQRVLMRSGQTLVMTGFTQSRSKHKETGTGNAFWKWLGGSSLSDETKDYLVIVITPRVTSLNVY